MEHIEGHQGLARRSLLRGAAALAASGAGALAYTAVAAPAQAAVRAEPWSVRSGNGRLDAVILRAHGAGRKPTIIVAGGLGGLFAGSPRRFAEYFVSQGFTAVGFDYRHFGASTGSPRRLIDNPAQVVDWKSMIRATRRLDGVDPNRIGVWGSSLGGGHVLNVAPDFPWLKAVVAQVPHLNGLAAGTSSSSSRLSGLAQKITADLAAAAAGRPPVEIPFAGRPGEIALMTAPGTIEYYQANVFGKVPGYVNSTPARSALSMLSYSPKYRALLSRVPTMIVGAAQDTVAPIQEARDLAAQLRATFQEYDANHFGLYTGALFQRVVADQAAFFSARLLG